GPVPAAGRGGGELVSNGTDNSNTQGPGGAGDGGGTGDGYWLIKGARLLGGAPADIRIADGVIETGGAGLAADAGAVSDADRLVGLRGLVDRHTHLREPGREDAETVETGTRAAALGGFTAVHAMANTEPVAETAGVVEQVWRLGGQAGYVDVRPVGAV